MTSPSDGQYGTNASTTAALSGTLNKHSKKDTFVQDLATANTHIIKIISQLEVSYYSGSEDQNTGPQEQWRQMANKHCQQWARAEQKLSKCKSELEKLSTPEQSPLGIIGRSLDSSLIDQAQQNYNQALAAFTLLDENLRSNNDLSQNFEAALRKHNLEQSHLQQLQDLKKQAMFQQRYIGDIQVKKDMSSVPQDIPAPPEQLDLCNEEDIQQVKSVIQVTEHILRQASPAYRQVQEKQEAQSEKSNRPFLGGLFSK